MLPRGGVVDLPDDVRDWTVSVAWPPAGTSVEVDVVAFLTDRDDEVRADSDFIFYNAPAAASGSVELTLGLTDEALVHVRLDRVPADVERVTVAATLPAGHTFGTVRPVQVVLRPADGEPYVRSILDAATTERSLLVACVYRRVGRWRFRTVGQGYEFGLAELATKFGVEVDG